jgi:hypothetical protein
MNRYNIPIDPKPDCFPMIGELATRWGWIENQTGVIIRELLRIKKPAGHMAIGNMGIQPKTRVITSLAQHLFKVNKLGREIKSLADTIQEFDKFRNDVIHGLWVYYPENTKELALLKTKSLQQKVDPHPDKDAVNQLAPKIAELRQIQNEAQRITDAIKALRGKFE